MGQRSFGISDAKAYPVTTEGDLCAGGVVTPVYGDGIDVGCVQEFSWNEEVVEAELKGDDTICGDVSRVQKISFKIKHGGLNPELLEALLGLTGADFTVATEDGRRTKRKKGDGRPRFGLIVQTIQDDEEKDIHLLLWNCRLKADPGATLGTEAYVEKELEGTAYLDLNTCDTFYDFIQHHESVIDIPAEWPGSTNY